MAQPHVNKKSFDFTGARQVNGQVMTPVAFVTSLGKTKGESPQKKGPLSFRTGACKNCR
jgi:hypothetical protein